jgi:hypothetical protein
MIDNRKNMSCEDFQEHLPELIGSGVDVSDHPHLETCELCRALLSDLETIAAAARELFPVEDPSDRVWEQIQSAIREEEGNPSPK